jgi:hypothetical protein
MIKVNDRVNYVYDIRLIGTVVELLELGGTEHFEGGTSAKKFMAIVKIDNSDRKIKVDINDLMKE